MLFTYPLLYFLHLQKNTAIIGKVKWILATLLRNSIKPPWQTLLYHLFTSHTDPWLPDEHQRPSALSVISGFLYLLVP